MESPAPLLSILPNLSIGVICVLALVYVTFSFLKHIAASESKHDHAMEKQQEHLRILEKEVRTSIMERLSENTRAFSRVMQHLEDHRK